MKSLEIIRKVYFIACLGSFSVAGMAQPTIPVANDVYDIGFNSTGSHLACTNENNILIWDMEANAVGMNLESGHKDNVLCLDYSPDNLEIASGGRDSMLIIWEIAGDQPRKKFHIKTNGIITAIEFSPHYPILAFGNTSNNIYLFDYQRNRIIDTLTGHQDDALSLSFLDEITLFSSGADGIIIKWNLEENKGHKYFTKNGFIYDIDINAKGNMLAAASAEGGLNMYRFDKNGKLKADLISPFSFAKYSSVDFGNNASFYVYTSLKGKIKVITPYTDLSYKIQYPATKIRIQPREDARIIIAVATLGGRVQIIKGEDLEY